MKPTHKIEVKKGKESKYEYISQEDVTRIVLDSDAKKQHIMINGEFYPRFSVGQIEQLTQEEMENYGGKTIWYTEKVICGNVGGKTIWRMKKYEETLKRNSEGGSSRKLIKTYHCMMDEKGNFSKISYNQD